MNTICIDKKDKERFKNNLLNDCKYENEKMCFYKTNKKVLVLLNELFLFPNVISNIIYEYAVIVFEIKYSSKCIKDCEITFNNEILNNVSLNISWSASYTNKFEIYFNIYSAINNTHIVNTYEQYIHNLDNKISFFNYFMNKYYNIKNYINVKEYGYSEYDYDKRMELIIDYKKLKYIIIMSKILISIINKQTKLKIKNNI